MESHQKAYSRVVDEHLAAIDQIISQFDGQLESSRFPKSTDHSSAQKLPTVVQQTSSRPASSFKSDSMKSRSSRTNVLLTKQASLKASRVRLKYLEQESVIEKQIADLDSLLKLKRAV